MPRQGKHALPRAGLADAQRELERSRRDYVQAIHEAAQTEQTASWFVRIRQRNHLGPSFEETYRRNR